MYTPGTSESHPVGDSGSSAASSMQPSEGASSSTPQDTHAYDEHVEVNMAPVVDANDCDNYEDVHLECAPGDESIPYMTYDTNVGDRFVREMNVDLAYKLNQEPIIFDDSCFVFNIKYDLLGDSFPGSNLDGPGFQEQRTIVCGKATSLYSVCEFVQGLLVNDPDEVQTHPGKTNSSLLHLWGVLWEVTTGGVTQWQPLELRLTVSHFTEGRMYPDMHILGDLMVKGAASQAYLTL